MAIGLAAPTDVQASEASAWDDWFGADAHFGTLHAPLGYLAVSAEFSPLPYLGLEVGFGKSDTNYSRGGAMLHARYGGRVLVFSLGAGFSFGPYAFEPNCPNESGAILLPRSCSDSFEFGRTEWQRAYFRNLEFGIEGRTGAGFHFRTALGSSAVLNRGDGTCVQPPCKPSDGLPSESHAYFDLAIGVSFL